MALALSPSLMTTSILLRPPPLAVPTPSPTPSPSPISPPLPALQADLSSSSSSSSGSYFDLHRASSARRIRFAPLPEPDRDLLDPSSGIPQSDTKSATPQATPEYDGFPAHSPTVSSAPSTLAAGQSPTTSSKHTPKLNLKRLRPFSFLRRADAPETSPLPQSPSLPNPHNASFPPLTRVSSSVSNSSSVHSPKLRITTSDILSLGRRSFFRVRPGSSNGSHAPRTASPPPKRSDLSKSRSASYTSSLASNPVNERRDWEQGSPQLHDTAPIVGSGSKRRRAFSSAMTPGAGGGRHTSSAKLLQGDLPPRPSTSPSPVSPLALGNGCVRMLNGRVYGAKRYAAQTLADPFANVRDEPEFVEWGYGGMGSVHASAGLANDMWKGLQRSERGSALLAGSSFESTTGVVTAGGGRGSGARATMPRRKMSDDIRECGMGNVGASGGFGEDDGSGMAWVKKRRAEREAKARLEQEAKELERKTREKRKSSDSMDTSMLTSTASTANSLTACTSAASIDMTTPTTSPLTSRSPSMTDVKLTSSPPSDSHCFSATPPCAVTGEQSSRPATTPPDEHEHHILTAVRLSPSVSCAIDTETTKSTSSSDEEEQDDMDDDGERGTQDVRRKTAVGAGVEKISRHIDAERW